MAQGQKTILITGASGGIGRAAVTRFVDRGWRVFAAVRREEAAQDFAGRVNVAPVLLDVCDSGSIERASLQVVECLAGGGLHALVNLAGYSADGPVELVPAEAWRRQFEVNLIGAVAVTQAFLPVLRTGRGRVVNVGGAAGRVALPMYGALSASKAALDALTEALRMELKHQHVRVIYVEPGAVKTDFFATSAELARRQGYAGDVATQAIYRDALAASAKAIAQSRAISPERVAEALIKAVSARRPASRYIVGTEAQLSLRVLRHLPARTRDRAIMSAFGLKPTALNGTPRGEPAPGPSA